MIVEERFATNMMVTGSGEGIAVFGLAAGTVKVPTLEGTGGVWF